MKTPHNFNYMCKQWASVRITCPRCLIHLSLEEFRTVHAVCEYGLDIHTQCAFCFGEHEWLPRQKGRQRTGVHLNECIRAFRRVNEVWQSPTVPDYSKTTSGLPWDFLDTNVKDPLPVCTECRDFDATRMQKSMDGRKVVREWKEFGFYDSVFERPSEWEGVAGAFPFDEKSGLSDAGGIFQRYFDFQWYHIQIKPFVFPHFVRALQDHRDRVVALRFWCFCDGLDTTLEGSEFRHHRHAILAIRNSFDKTFHKIWDERVLNPDYAAGTSNREPIKGKYCKKITNPSHLAEVVLYLGQSRSSCSDERVEEKGHYWINGPIYPSLGLSLLGPNGLAQLLHYRYQNYNVSRLVDRVKKVRSDFFVPIKHLNLIVSGCVLPVRKCYEPVSEEGAISEEEEDVPSHVIHMYS